MTDEKMYTFWLCNKQGIGIKKITDLLCFFKEAEYIFKASKEELMQVRSLKEKDIDLLLSGQDEDRLKRDYEEMYKKGIQFVYKKKNSILINCVSYRMHHMVFFIKDTCRKKEK